METLTFKEAIKKWEYPLGETMIGYSTLKRKATIDPTKIFVIIYWDEEKEKNEYKSFCVGLKKEKNKWVVNKELFDIALKEKIKAAEDSNRLEKTNIEIKYPYSDDIFDKI